MALLLIVLKLYLNYLTKQFPTPLIADNILLYAEDGSTGIKKAFAEALDLIICYINFHIDYGYQVYNNIN